MPLVSKSVLFRLVRLLNRFVPIIARGVGLGLAIAAIATLVLGMGEYSEPLERYVFTGIFTFFALVSFGIGRAIKPILRWVLRRS